ncbi:hypothetical protein [Brachybacterium fresconis]|uniref:Membrane channel-forming protein YqfA (Hemolysin III family) n=1 Tax=Brachybacterium fresconis TaxID=173363 RepID=A0ABS4YLZ0_9MICO|nr:hypothetical protein [Brachybacterium fresconis]MBP2409810.1 putative membrane channel-forming protein YqfA (hemolysin III family) [Brachybacterium fresconis]
MTTTNSRPPLPAPTLKAKDVPVPLFVGLGVGLLGFFVQFTSWTTSTMGGVETCTYHDYAAMIAAVVCLLCAGIGISRRVSQPRRYPIRQWVVHLMAGVLVLLAVVHALRGFGIIGGIC